LKWEHHGDIHCGYIYIWYTEFYYIWIYIIFNIIYTYIYIHIYIYTLIWMGRWPRFSCGSVQTWRRVTPNWWSFHIGDIWWFTGGDGKFALCKQQTLRFNSAKCSMHQKCNFN
jgi:hypothetical protein